MGEGWHNNHHRFQWAERHGIAWWEIDVTHMILKLLSWFGVVWDLKEPPKNVMKSINSKKDALVTV